MADSIADSWEDLENGEELDKKLEKLVQPIKAEQTKEKSVVMPKLQEDTAGRTPYQSTVRILKRESNNLTNNSSLSDPRLSAVKPPIRTLEEREAAYAEARLRILGSAFSPEDEEEKASDSSSGTATPTNLSSVKSPSPQPPPTSKQQGSRSPRQDGSLTQQNGSASETNGNQSGDR